MRLDIYLLEKGFTSSRTEAKNLIMQSMVKVGDKIILKPSFDVNYDADDITVDRSGIKYVSRGGLKLEAALSAFDTSATGKDVLDIGSSTGGFTDCLLQHGAARVIALDSGTSQLATKIRNDPRVFVMENYNARYMVPDEMPFQPQMCVMDVSFISATYIIPVIKNILLSGSDFICLIKPQFEVGKSGLGKGGIVKSDKLRSDAVKKVIDFAEQNNFSLISLIRSPIIGGDGNIEFLAHFRLGEYNEKNTDNTKYVEG